jgi:hypothetical protein
MTTLSAAASSRAWTARLTVPVVLGAVVAGAIVVHAIAALRVPAPWMFPDEIRYSELAKSLADGQLPSIRGAVTFEWGLVYPLLLAPSWALFHDVAVAYDVAKVINAMLLGLTAVPVYFLGRRFVDERSALVAAALSVCIPSLLYAGTLMTEVALYPAFALALLAIAVAVERPTPISQLAALAAIAIAIGVKMLAISLVASYLVSVLAYSALEARSGADFGRRLRAYTTTWIVLLAGVVLVVALGLRGREATSVLGTYEQFTGNIDLLTLPALILLHLAAFDLFVVITPFAATALVVVAGLRREADSSLRLFAVMTPAVALPLLAVVAAYSSAVAAPILGYAAGDGPNERATFVLAPLAFVGLVMWLRDRPGSPRLVAVTALAAGVLPAVIPAWWFELNVVRDQAFSLIPWERARDAIHWPIGVLVVGVLLAAVFIVLARTEADSVAFVAPVAVVLIAVTFAAQTFVELTSSWSRSVGVGDSKGWVQRAAGGESVSVLWYEPVQEGWMQPAARHRVVWHHEFFNRNVDGVYELGSPMPYGPDLRSTHVRLRNGEVVLDDGSPANLGDYVLAPCFVHVDGDPVARDAATGATLYRVPDVVRATVGSWRSC